MQQVRNAGGGALQQVRREPCNQECAERRRPIQRHDPDAAAQKKQTRAGAADKCHREAADHEKKIHPIAAEPDAQVQARVGDDVQIHDAQGREGAQYLQVADHPLESANSMILSAA